MIPFPFLIKAVGLVAGTGTTVSFLPQVIRIFRSSSTHDLSLSMFLIHSTGVVLWVVYGVLLKDWIIVGFNTATLCLNAAILSFFVRGATPPPLPVVSNEYGPGSF